MSSDDRTHGSPEWLAALADSLRRAGVNVSVGQVVDCHRAFASWPATPVSATDRYWICRTSLITKHDDLATFDAVFSSLIGGEGHVAVSSVATVPADAGSDRQAPGEAGPDVTVGGQASAAERLRHRRFADASSEEHAEIARLLDRLAISVPRRRSRRLAPSRQGVLDLDRTLQRALMTDGELIDRQWRDRRDQARQLVIVLDVSGSMAPFSRAMLRFALAARRSADRSAARRVEVFAFGTRLTRLSDELAVSDVDEAFDAAANRVADWDGGTRIGACLDELVREWGARGVLRGAVVVVCSDGLERGDPTLLAEAVARLRRHAYRLVWVNPLAGDKGFAPVQRGMAAALAAVDMLCPAHDFASLESLADALAELR